MSAFCAVTATIANQLPPKGLYHLRTRRLAWVVAFRLRSRIEVGEFSESPPGNSSLRTRWGICGCNGPSFRLPARVPLRDGIGNPYGVRAILRNFPGGDLE